MRWSRSLTLLALIPPVSAPAASDPEALRRLVPLPRVTFAMNISFQQGDIGVDKQRHAVRIRQLAAHVKRRPKDSAARLELARLYYDTDRAAEKREARVALKLLKADAKARPRDPRIMARLGDALTRTDDPAAGLKLLRQATERMPRDRYAWTARADAAQGRATKALFAGLTSGKATSSDFAAMWVRYQAHKPAKERIAEVETLLREASASLDMAVKCEPSNPDAYLERANFHFMNVFWSFMLKGLDEDESTEGSWAEIAPARDDFLRVARMLRTDARAWLAPVMVDLMAASATHREELESHDTPGDLWKVLSDEEKARFHEPVTALKRLSTHADGKVAAKASETLGTVLYITGDEKASEAVLRRAIALAPEARGAWDSLIAILGRAQRWKDAAQLARQYVARHDSPRSRLVLAKTLDKSDDKAGAGEQVLLARKRFPKDTELALAAIALDLRKPQSAAALADIGTRLALLEATAGQRASSDLKENLEVIRAFLLGLQGNDDQAKPLFEKLSASNPDDEVLKEALEAVGG